MHPKLKEILSFSRKETVAVLLFVFIIIAFIFLPKLFTKENKPYAVDKKWEAQLAQVLDTTSAKKQYAQTDFDETNNTETELFYFNPNTLDEAGFKRLGLSDKNIKTLINYRSKGGQFRKPEDLKRIYGIPPALSEKLVAYVKLDNNSNTYSNNNYNNNYTPYTKKQPKIIDINTATAEDFEQLPGIGKAYAARFIKYREARKGFKSIDDIAKTYGLPDSTFQLIKPYLTISQTVATPTKPSLININTARESELMECKNMTSDMAKAIIASRKQKGNYNAVKDIRRIIFINEEMYNSIAPCLTVE